MNMRDRYASALRGMPEGGGVVGRERNFQPSGPQIQQQAGGGVSPAFTQGLGKMLGAKLGGGAGAAPTGAQLAGSEAALSAPLANPTNTLAGGAGAGGGGSGASGAMMSAGPWAALAAAAILNEKDSQDKGIRSGSGWGQARDFLTGKVGIDDMRKKFIPAFKKLF